MSTPLSFNASWYLSQNPDVAAAIEAGAPFNAFEHFTLYGRAENRSASPVFDAQEYLNSNPDVAEAVAQGLITAWDHFELFGGAEGRSPTPLFNEAFYLQQNPDVAAAIEQGIISSAAQHFALFGQSEPRAINPAINLGQYINANPDIGQAAANGLINLFDHLLQYGVTEGRDLGNGVVLSNFSNDPSFTQSLAGGNAVQALIRVETVAPFLPTFERPAGWTPPANTPVPVDFVPPADSGIKLVVPPEVVVPDDVELPDTFEPVTPPVTPPGGGGEVVDTTKQTINVSGQADETHYTTAFDAGVTHGTIQLSDFDPNSWLIVTGDDLTTLTVAGELNSDGGIYLDVGNSGALSEGWPEATGKAEITTLNVSLTGGPASIWQWGTNAFGIETVNASGSDATLISTIHAGGDGGPIAGKVALTNMIGGTGVDQVALDPKVFADSVNTFTVNLGAEDDTFSLDAVKTKYNAVPFTFDNEDPGIAMTIYGGEGDDTIDSAVGSTVSGGAGNDTFVIRSKAGTGVESLQVTIKDYGDGNDIIDLTQVPELNLEGNDGDRLEVHQGDWGFGSDIDMLIQLSGGSGTQVVLEGAYDKTATIKILSTQLGDLSTPIQNYPFQLPENHGPIYFMTNISDGGVIDASSSSLDQGVIIAGGGGAQTITGGTKNDLIVGGKGSNTYYSSSGSDTYISSEGESSSFTYTDSNHSAWTGSIADGDVFDFSFLGKSPADASIRFNGTGFDGAITGRNDPGSISEGGFIRSSLPTQNDVDAVNFFVVSESETFVAAGPSGGNATTGQYSFVYIPMESGNGNFHLFVDANGNGNLDVGDMHIKLLGTVPVDTYFGPEAT